MLFEIFFFPKFYAISTVSTSINSTISVNLLLSSTAQVELIAKYSKNKLVLVACQNNVLIDSFKKTVSMIADYKTK